MKLQFLRGGGEMGAALRDHNWSASPLGSPDAWPQALKTIVCVMLASPQAMLVLWGEAQWMLCNDGGREILGDQYPTVGQPFSQLRGGVVDELGPMAARARAGEPTEAVDFALDSQRDGQAFRVHVSFHLAAIADDNGQVAGVLCACTETAVPAAATREQSVGGQSILAFGRDITDLKAHQRALEHRHEQLRHLLKMEAVVQLTGAIAHDFNNTLAGVYGSIQLMQRRLNLGRFDDFEKLLERASTSTKQAAALTHRLLGFAGHQSLNIHRVDVAKLLAALSQKIHVTLGDRIACRTVVGTDVWSANIEADQLESAILNLLLNSRDALPDGGAVIISVANLRIGALRAADEPELHPGDYLALSVTDNGCGMSSDTLARLRESFLTTLQISPGPGLGLPVVHSIVRLAGGHVGLHSELGTGTTVRLCLRRSLSEAEVAAAKRSEPTALPG